MRVVLNAGRSQGVFLWQAFLFWAEWRNQPPHLVLIQNSPKCRTFHGFRCFSLCVGQVHLNETEGLVGLKELWADTAIQMECFLPKALSLHCSACSYLLCQGAGSGGVALLGVHLWPFPSFQQEITSHCPSILVFLPLLYQESQSPHIPPPRPRFLAKDAFPPVCESGERKMLMDPKINVSRDSHSLHYKACSLVTTQRQSVSLRAAQGSVQVGGWVGGGSRESVMALHLLASSHQVCDLQWCPCVWPFSMHGRCNSHNMCLGVSLRVSSLENE